MAQTYPTIDANPTTGDTGTTLAGKINNSRDALLSSHAGTSQPSYVAAGTIWLDTTATPWVLKMYDGAQDVPVLEINATTHVVTKVYINEATTSLAGLMSAADKTKIDGIAAGATVNSADATLLARANHTGSQAISTVTGLQTAIDGKAALAVEDQTLSGGFRVSSKALNSGNPVTSGTVTLDSGDRPGQYYTNGGAHSVAAPANDGFLDVLITNNSNAGVITLTGFDFIGGDVFTTTNGHKFILSVRRINGVSLAMVLALQ